MMRHGFALTVVGTLMVALVVAGCGGGVDRTPVAKVTCTVTVNGDPLPHGVITFTPDREAGTKGRPSSGGIKDGKVESLTCYKKGDGAIVGKHKVSIIASKPTSGASVSGHPSSNAASGAAVSKPGSGPKQPIPAKYNTKTTLTATVEAGKVNELTFDLKIQGFKAP